MSLTLTSFPCAAITNSNSTPSVPGWSQMQAIADGRAVAVMQWAALIR